MSAHSELKTGATKNNLEAPVTVSDMEHSKTNESNSDVQVGEQYDMDLPRNEAGQQVYSKVSVYLSFLFSGLAMGADG